jgi:sec-independent protein translocase protein TatB
MFDIAWSELALIGAVALVVIGPKDLPRVMRTAGQWARKARLLAAEFQRNVEDMVREVEKQDIDVMKAKPPPTPTFPPGDDPYAPSPAPTPVPTPAPTPAAQP